MKILLVTFYALPSHYGGINTYVMDLARCLQTRGQEVRIFCVEANVALSGETAIDTLEYLEILIDRLSYPRARFRTLPEQDDLARRYLAKVTPDVVHFVSGWGLFLFSQALSCPSVYTAADHSLLCSFSNLLQGGVTGTLCDGPGTTKCRACILRASLSILAQRLTWSGNAPPRRPIDLWRSVRDLIAALRDVPERLARARACCERLSLLIAPCPHMKEVFEAYDCRRGKVHVSVYGTRPTEVPLLRQKPPGPLTFGYVGRFHPIKGLDILLRAFATVAADLSEVALRVYGDFQEHLYVRYNARLKRLLETTPAVDWLGSIDQGALDEAYRTIDVLVVPSIWYENAPITILEALARKRPVIASDVAGIRSLVEDGVNGLLFRRGDVGHLAERLASMAQSPSLVTKLSENIGPVKSIEADAEELVAHYERLLKDHR